ncbi:MAG: NAD-dependent epimerase/dehydratase family protein [Deltaproteobacteria bacterium]|nr:NAD-dependent epimerase/dehydratase family protein [Deltaproteobacteria bacterium]
MTTLITGAAGFLGSHIVRRLVARGDSVRALDLRPGVDLVADVTDREAVVRAMHGVARVIHVAAIYELGTRDVARMERVNVAGTENVLSAARDAGIPAVHVSTVAALGSTGIDLADETHWNDEAPRSAYAATKRAAHLVARRHRARIAMPATIFGPGDPSMFGRAHRLLRRAPFGVVARPEMRLCFVHVEDCADGVIRVADRGLRARSAGLDEGGEWVLSAGVLPLGEWLSRFKRPALTVPDRVLDLGAALAARLPAAVRERSPALRLLEEAGAMSAGVHWSFDGRRAREELGWSPRPIESCIADAAA